MTKYYVLDTNVLLHNPMAMFVFDEHQVIIPEAVLEELNKFKWESDERGINARMAGRLLDQLRKEGRLDQGVPLDNGGYLRVELNHYKTPMPPSWDMRDGDNRILQVCKGLAQNHQEDQIILVSKDVLLRVKAEALQLHAQDFTNDKVSDEQYLGRAEIYVPRDSLEMFFKYGEGIPLTKAMVYSTQGGMQKTFLEQNQFVLMRSAENQKQTGLGRVWDNHIVPMSYFKEEYSVYGLRPKSVGQKFLLEALLAPAEVAPLVIGKGPAGTGKTLLALAAGLREVMERTGRYRRVLVLRPNSTMDENIGFLPGDERSKIDPLMRPIYDNLEIILDSDEKGRYEDEKALQDKIAEVLERRYIVTESIGYMRGRSIAKHYVIIDEAQNLTPKQAKGIITRAGHGTKIVLLGDPAQIDRPFLDSISNGLSYASERMKGSSYCWQVALTEEESERSELAKEGAMRL